MTLLETILMYIAMPTAVVTFIFMLLWVIKIDDPAKLPKHLPKVAVLVAARNEENNIARCMDALLTLDYPKNRLEIWVGNDESTDSTLNIIKEYAEREKQINFIDITGQMGKAKGKANVLAQLAAASESKHILITDADIAVPESWAQSMVAEAERKEGIGIVVGTTVIKKGNFFAALESMDWLFALGKVKSLYDLGLPVSAMGNNMLVTREAYESTGGYEELPFNITEDHELFHQVRKKKWKARCIYSKDVLALSEPVGSVGGLLDQRKRWMRGAMQLNPFLILVLFMHAVFYPAVVTMLIVNPQFGLAIWGIKLFIQGVFMLYLMDRLKLLKYFFSLPFYEVYSLIFTPMLIVYYVLPMKLKWKGRSY